MRALVTLLPYSNSCRRTAPASLYFSAVLAGLLSACGGGGGAPSSSQTVDNPSQSPQAPISMPSTAAGHVMVSGQITFARVPHSTSNFGLDYASEFAAPARAITVQAVDAQGEIEAQTQTDSSGQYKLELPDNTPLAIRAVAHMHSDGTSASNASWDVAVIDNTQDEAGYVLQGDLVSTGEANSVRNLYAPSGWDGIAYSQMRMAAPFAILDTLYDALQRFEAVDPDINFPALTIGWSENNSTARGAISDGHIGSSQYDPLTGHIYLLGKEGNDTDEYDPHVVVHEFGHFFEDTLSRSDSIGGAHSATDFLDPRVALGEGFGNALAAIVLDDPKYRDSLNLNQESGFIIDIENNAPPIVGWYSEASVHSVLYDIYDSERDGIDRLAAGFEPIYLAMTEPEYKQAASFTTMFSLTDELRKILGTAEAEQMDLLLLAQGMIGADKTGIGESNSGGLTHSLPLYKSLTASGPVQTVCSYAEKGTGNQLGNFAFVSLSVPQTGTYTLRAVQNDGGLNADPDMKIYRAGELVVTADSLADGREDWTGSLGAGDYSLAIYDYENSLQYSAGRTACFSLDFDFSQ